MNHILHRTIHRPYIDMKTVSTHACLCNNFQLVPGTHPGFCGGRLDLSCLLPWPTIHCIILNSSSKSCKSTTLTRRVFNTKYNIYRDLSITHSVHTELYHLIISKLIHHSEAKAVPCPFISTLLNIIPIVPLHQLCLLYLSISSTTLFFIWVFF